MKTLARRSVRLEEDKRRWLIQRPRIFVITGDIVPI